MGKPDGGVKVGSLFSGIGGLDLRTVVSEMYPTPSTRDWKDTPGMAMEATNPDGSTRDRTDQLARRVYSLIGQGGGQDSPGLSVTGADPTLQATEKPWRLSVTFTEWLMGFPFGWTRTSPTEQDDSKALETR